MLILYLGVTSDSHFNFARHLLTIKFLGALLGRKYSKMIFTHLSQKNMTLVRSVTANTIRHRLKDQCYSKELGSTVSLILREFQSQAADVFVFSGEESSVDGSVKRFCSFFCDRNHLEN